MLVITTQEGEAIQIGEDVRILVRRVKGGWVRLCIDAPREIPIQRVEAPPAPGPQAGAAAANTGAAGSDVARRPRKAGEGA